MGSNKENEYLDMCVAFEKKTLEVSNALKLLNILKLELDTLNQSRNKLRSELQIETNANTGPLKRDMFNR